MNFIGIFLKNFQAQNLMEISPVGARVVPCGRTKQIAILLRRLNVRNGNRFHTKRASRRTWYAL
jgi:hypothetical protein